MRKAFKKAASILCAVSMVCAGAVVAEKPVTVEAANPYLPLWEHVPDGEPHVFEDPDNPGKYRVYIYGSHDINRTSYCGDNQVVWSAPVEDPTDWRYEGISFQYDLDGNGENDVLYAPDVCEVIEDGEKVYYLYPNDMNSWGVVAKSDRPAGPFEVVATNGQLGGDPAVFVDDDGRVYGYWGWQSSYCAELNTDMATLKSQVYTYETTNMAGYNVETKNEGDDNEFRFYEASSMRKILGKYVWVYSRWTKDGEDGLPASNATLAYAYSDSPLGPFTYGGTIIDARAKNVDEEGNAITAWASGNTHGSLCEIDGQWYIFYHRQTNKTETCRQGMADPVNIYMDGDKLVIEEAEMTSQGFELDGLDPYEVHSAGLSCYITGDSAYVEATYDEEVDSNPVADIKNGTTVGFKYFNFDEANADTKLQVAMTAYGRDGKVSVMLDSPYASKGTEIGSFDISASDMRCKNVYEVELSDLTEVEGKHAVYFNFTSDSDKVIAKFHDLVFTDGTDLLLEAETEEPYFGPVDRTKWTATSNPSNVGDESENTALAFDDDVNTRWATNKHQSGDEWFVLNMGNTWTFNEVHLGGNGDYPRGYKVSVSNDGENYTELTTGTCDDSANPYLTIKFDKQRAQYIKIEQTATEVDGFCYWSINDLKVYYNDPEQISKAGWSVLTEGKAAWWGTEHAIDDVLDDNSWGTILETDGKEAFVVDMGRTETFNQLVLDSRGNYLREYEILVSADGTNYTSVASGNGSVNEDGLMIVEFEDQTARYIKVAQAGETTGIWWSIHEFTLYQRPEPTPTPTPTPDPTPTPTPDPTPTPIQLPFEDVTEDDPNFAWFGEGIKSMYEQGIMGGYTDTRFAPYDNITRADFVLTLYRIAGTPEVTYEDMFPDVKEDDYFADAVIWALGDTMTGYIVTGYDDGNFHPTDKISRQDMVTILYRYAGRPADKATGDLSVFADAGDVYEYAEQAMQWAIAEGLVKGNADGTLKPQANITRAEIAVILDRYIG